MVRYSVDRKWTCSKSKISVRKESKMWYETEAIIIIAVASIFWVRIMYVAITEMIEDYKDIKRLKLWKKK